MSLLLRCVPPVPQRVLRDASITAKYEKSIKGVFCAEYTRAQHRRSLKQLLALVLFLDAAKVGDVLDLGVCTLFDPASPVKSSKEVVRRLSEELLAGEGDVNRHLFSMGYNPVFEQHPMDEFDFKVSNLATDLRDGVRLARLYEIMEEKAPLTTCRVRDRANWHLWCLLWCFAVVLRWLCKRVA